MVKGRIERKEKELDETLAKKRILLLVGEITHEKAIAARERLLFLNSQSNKEIKLIIDSRGGDVVAALRLYDALLLSSAPVTVIVNGECSSSGVAILQAAKKRLATEHSFFYLHPLSIIFKKEEIAIDEKTEERFRNKLRGVRERQKFIYDILIKKTGRSLKEIKAMEEKVTFAKKAKELGLIDEVIEEESIEEYKIY